MEKYISLDALVAGIKTRIETYNKGYANGDDCRADALETFLHDIDTLEVKEVDLEKEIKDYIYAIPHAKTGIPNGWRLSWHEENVIEIAKHFYELGLNSQRKISYVPNIDDSLKELGVDPDSKEAKIFKESYYTALEKLKAQKGE